MRSRLVKPEFFRNEGLAELPMGAMLLFEGLWCLADREGRLRDRPRIIRSDVFPARDEVTSVDVEAWLRALAQHPQRFIVRYEADGEPYIAICNFAKHQKIHQNEAPSTIPAPPIGARACPNGPSASPIGTRSFPSITSDSTSDSDSTSEAGGSASRSSRARVEKRSTKWPEGLALTDELRAVAERHGMAPERVAGVWEHFESHHRSRGSKFEDWNRAWLTWVLREPTMGGRNAPRGASQQAPRTAAETTMANLDEVRRKRGIGT